MNENRKQQAMEKLRSISGPRTLRVLEVLERLETVSDDVRREEDHALALPYSSSPKLKPAARWAR